MNARKNAVLGALVALGMLLAACGPQAGPGQPAGYVTLSVALDSSLSAEGVQPAGAPYSPGGGIAVEEVLVSVEDRLGQPVTFELAGGVYTASTTGAIDAVPLTPGDPSAQVALPAAGNPYTFVSRGLDDADVVIAFDETVKAVGQSDTVVVTLESVLGGAVLTPRLPTSKVTPGTSIDLLLVVMANGNASFPDDYLQVPLSDFEVAYGAVEGGTVVASSQRGLRIQVDEGCTELIVGGTVTGLLESGGGYAAGDLAIAPFALECLQPATGGIGVDLEAPELTDLAFDAVANTVSGNVSDDNGVAKIEVWDGPVLVATSEIDAPSGSVAPVDFTAGTGAFSATLLVSTGGVTVIAFDHAGNQSERFLDHSEDVWVWAGYAGGDSDGSEQRPFTDLQAGLNAVSPGGTVHVRAGAYESHDFAITKPLVLSGEGVGAVVIETTSPGYGLEVSADGVTLRGFTLRGPGLAAGNYGIKAFLEDGLDDLVIEDVYVTNYGRSEIDLNTVRGATLTNVTADGNGTDGVGIALSGVEDVALKGVATTGNLWGSVGLYTTAAGTINGVSGVSIDATSSFHELGRTVYIDAEHGFPVTDLQLAGFGYAVFNPDQRGVDASCPEPLKPGRGEDFIDFAKTLDVAVGLALDLCPATSDAAYVQHLGVDGSGYITFENRFSVGAGMGIQAAVDAAADGGVIELGAGTFDAGFSVANRAGLTVVGAGKGASVVNASAALNSGIDHKDRDDMGVVVLVNASTDVTLEGFSVRADGLKWQSQLDALVFWNASSGTIQGLDIAGPGLQTGAQTGQGLAVDASAGETVALSVVDTDFSGWNKNAIDIVDGNRYNAGGDILVDVSGGTFTGAGPTSTIGQNGILYWGRFGGSVSGTVSGVTIEQLEYTPDTDSASGILAYGDANLASVSDSTFAGSVESYIVNATANPIDATANNTFDGVLGSTAAGDDLTAITERLSGDVTIQ